MARRWCSCVGLGARRRRDVARGVSREAAYWAEKRRLQPAYAGQRASLGTRPQVAGRPGRQVVAP